MREKWGRRFGIAVPVLAAVNCGGERVDEIKGFDGRLAKVEAALGAMPPAPSSSGPTLSDLEQRLAKLEQITQESSSVLNATREPLTVDATGNEVCARKNQVCVAVVHRKSSLAVDMNQVPCGHTVADCNSRVSKRPCQGNNNYVVSPIKFLKSPGMKGQCGDASNETCIGEPSSFLAICLR